MELAAEQLPDSAHNTGAAAAADHAQEIEELKKR